MKIKQKIVLCYSVLFLSIPCLGHSTKKTERVIHMNHELEIQNALYAPVNFSPEGVSNFLTNGYNNPEYSYIITTKFDHFKSFLLHGKKTKQSKPYFKSVLKLFGNKIKSAPYINAYAFSDMLNVLPELLCDHFLHIKLSVTETQKEAIKDILFATFLSKYEMFKKDTQTFFDNLSQEILESMHNDLITLHENAATLELRQSLIRFLEISINKLIWSPQEHEKIWDNVKKISKQLEALLDYAIIDGAADLDDLYWSLIHRFCYFVELSKRELPLEFYTKVKNDMACEQLLLFELEEQEPLVESKAKRLLRTIINGQVEKEAEKNGIRLAKA